MKFTLLPLFIVASLISISPDLAGDVPDSKELVEKLFSNPLLTNAKLSPDGRYLASLSYHRAERSLVVLDLETKEFGGANPHLGHDIGTFSWIDSDKIVFRVTQWNYYTSGLYVYSVRKNSSRRITHLSKPAGLFRGTVESFEMFGSFVDPLLHVEGEFVYTGYRRSSSYPTLFTRNIHHSLRKVLATNTGQIFRYVVNQEGEPVFAMEGRSGDLNVLKWDSNTKGWSEGLPVTREFEPVGLLSGSSYYVTCVWNDEGYCGINLLDLEKGKFPNPPRFVPGYDMMASGVRNQIIDNMNGYVIGITVHMEKPFNFWLNGALNKVEALLKTMFDDHVLDFLGFNPGNNSVYYVISSDTMPPALYELNLETKEIALVYRQLPKAEGLDFRPMEPIYFESSDGEAIIHGYLTKPKGEGPFPAVLMVHGGPHSRDTWGFDSRAQFFALNGYAVLQINYRGSSGYGRKYGEAPLGVIATLSVEDIITGAKWLIKEKIAEADSIGIMGGSFGGYVSVAAAAKAPDLFQAAAAFAGIYDWNRLYEEDNRPGNMWLDDFYMDYDEDLYTDISPIHMAEQIKAPIFLVHGKADGRVGVSQSKAMVNALRKAGKQVETMYINWGRHGLPEEKDRLQYFQNLLLFMDEKLK